MITLKKKNKKTGKISRSFFDTYEELEGMLSRISTSYYKISDYTITSDDFEDLIKAFYLRYNPNYFEIDDVAKEIIIKKLNPSEKRNIVYNKTFFEKEKPFTKEMRLLNNKYDMSYDEDLGIIDLRINGETISFELSENNLVKTIELASLSPFNVRTAFAVILDVIKRFEKINKREPN